MCYRQPALSVTGMSASFVMDSLTVEVMASHGIHASTVCVLNRHRQHFPTVKKLMFVMDGADDQRIDYHFTRVLQSTAPIDTTASATCILYANRTIDCRAMHKELESMANDFGCSARVIQRVRARDADVVVVHVFVR